MQENEEENELSFMIFAFYFVIKRKENFLKSEPKTKEGKK
jgi:hypothetical protein